MMIDPSAASQSTWSPRYAGRMSRMQASEIRELLKVIDRPGVISLAGGVPDPALFPKTEAAAAYQDILARSGDAALQYSVSEGDPRLVEWIVRRMTAVGAPCQPENVLITSGSQQALEFLGRLLISPGDTALVATPTYLGALQAFAGCEPRYETTPKASSNRTGAFLRSRARAEGGDVSFAYLVPDFANPTGETLTEPERKALLDLASEADAPAIEDSPYAALRYEGMHERSLLALDIERTGHIDRSRVIHCGSFSKIFAPGLRVGWVVARRDVIERLTLLKQASDLNAPRINQLVVARLAETLFETQIEKARAHYRPKRDAMLEALAAHMPAGANWSRPKGGMFVWLKLPEHIDAAALAPTAVERAGVAYVPGSAFFHDGSGRNTVRLSFSSPAVEDIHEGVKRLATLVREAPATSPN